MSQNSLVLPTSGTLSGLAAVEAVNAALDTLNTLAAGASAPSSVEAGQLWHDTGNNLLKLRSLDNTTWIVIGALNETGYAFNAAVKASPNLHGLTIANDATTPNSIIDIASGAAYDSQAVVYMTLAAGTKKNITAAWAAGTGNGSLDTGTFAASTFYHVHLICNAANGVTDVLTSLSFGNPVLPAGYTNFVPIGAVLGNGSGNIVPFLQLNDRFLFSSYIGDAAGATLSATAQNITLSVPKGVSLIALIQAEIQSTLAAQVYLTVHSPLIGSVAANLYSIPSNGSTLEYNTAAMLEVVTNSAGQVVVQGSSNQSGSTTSWSLYTYGFVYPRGLQ